MKRMNLLLAFSMLLVCSAGFGQKEKTISSMKAGSVLTDADIGFLTMVAGVEIDPTKPGAVRSVTIKGVSYKTGHAVTATEAKSLSSAIKSFQKNYKAPTGSRGAGWCYYWYYYCDWYGYCYWYKYWYYC